MERMKKERDDLAARDEERERKYRKMLIMVPFFHPYQVVIRFSARKEQRRTIEISCNFVEDDPFILYFCCSIR